MKTSDNKVLLALQVWIAAAWADGVITEQEATGMRATIELAKLSDADKAVARGWLTKKIDLDDINVSQIPKDDRTNIFTAALGVVAMDNKVGAAEHKFLDRLKIALQIDDVTAAEIRKRVGV
ncbi:MAG TPA: DUF533 domain-containing protein [Kofleriaceae bacterium]|nr:DUF533 domain-containing protein [Kofleriaceae bacterium]